MLNQWWKILDTLFLQNIYPEYFRFPGAAGGGQGPSQGGNDGGQFDEGDDDLYS